MKKILLLIGAALLFTACPGDEFIDDNNGNGGEEVERPAKRTVMVYMSAENSLSSNAQGDINEMIRGMKSVSKYDNLLIFVDRASSRENPFIARLQNDDAQPVDTIKKYESDFYASDPDKMKDVIQWMMTNYPADDYGLVLWGHGNGWIIMDSISNNRAIAVDNGENKANDNGRWLNIPSLRMALSALPHSFKFIFADCCNMQNVEVAYELKDVTDYYIASPAGIPGDGAPYHTIVPDLFIYDDVQMYTKICDDYNALKDGEGGHLPISAVRTKDLPSLAAATKTILQTIDWTAVNTDGLIYYYSYSTRNANEHVLYDMNDFLLRHADTTAYQEWKKALDQAIAYKLFSARWQVAGTLVFDFEMTEERYGGISMFVPLERYNNTLIKYNETINKMAWYHAVGWAELGW